MKKYEFTGETKIVDGHTVRRIKALENFGCVRGFPVGVGEIGGWIEHEGNLFDNAWISGNAVIYGGAMAKNNSYICCRAKVHGTAIVAGDFSVGGDAEVYGDVLAIGKGIINDEVKVYGNATIKGDVVVHDNVEISGDAYIEGEIMLCGDAKVDGKAFIRGMYITICGTAHITGRVEQKPIMIWEGIK